MAIGERIRFFRNKAGLTQKQLGLMVGFSETSAEVRIAQYESGCRSPKNDLIKKLSRIFNVSPDALCVPNIDREQLLFTLFTLEDLYGFQICRSGSHLYLVLGDTAKPTSPMDDMLLAWSNCAELLKNGKMSKEEYDKWRYNFTVPTKKSASTKTKQRANKNSLTHR